MGSSKLAQLVVLAYMDIESACCGICNTPDTHILGDSDLSLKFRSNQKEYLSRPAHQPCQIGLGRPISRAHRIKAMQWDGLALFLT